MGTMGIRRLSKPLLLSAMLLWYASLFGGCGETVQEDRSINYSQAGGASVGFQHSDQGLFIATEDGQGLERIFQPDEETVATSRPLWSPVDQRLIFTTARLAVPTRDPNATARIPMEDDPEGNLFLPVPVEYTCWLREAAQEGVAPENRRLFTAWCNHAGYVARCSWGKTPRIWWRHCMPGYSLKVESPFAGTARIGRLS